MSIPTTAQVDSIIGPLIEQLIVVSQQIAGIGACYPKVPEQAPDDNSVMYACKDVVVASSTNGRLTLHLTFDIVHVFRRARLQDTLARCYAALPAWLTVLSARTNVTLGGVAQLTDVQRATIGEVTHGSQKMLGVITTVVVRYEFPTP